MSGNGNSSGNGGGNPFLAFGRSSAAVLSDALLRASSGPASAAAAAAGPSAGGSGAPAATPAAAPPAPRADAPRNGGGSGSGSGNGNGKKQAEPPTGSGRGPEKRPEKPGKPYSAEVDAGRWAGLGILGLAATGLYVNDVDVTRLPSAAQRGLASAENVLTVTGPTMLQKAQAALQRAATAEGAQRLARGAAETVQRAAQAIQTQYVRVALPTAPSSLLSAAVLSPPSDD